MTSPEVPYPNNCIELPGSPVPWWSDSIIVAVPSPLVAIRLGVTAECGWKRKVRVSLIQNGITQHPTIYIVSESTMKIRLATLDPIPTSSDFSPCLSLEFEFGEAPDHGPGRPWVVIHPKLPIFIVPSVVPTLAPSIVFNSLQDWSESGGNKLQLIVHGSHLL